MVRNVLLGKRGARRAAHGLDDAAGDAVDAAAEGLGDAGPADDEAGLGRPARVRRAVRCGPARYGGGLAVRQEAAVLRDVGDDVVDCGAGVGERAGGGEELWGSRGEGVGDEGAVGGEGRLAQGGKAGERWEAWWAEGFHGEGWLVNRLIVRAN